MVKIKPRVLPGALLSVMVVIASSSAASACGGVVDPAVQKDEYEYLEFEHGFDAVILTQIFRVSFGPIKWGVTDSYKAQVQEVWRGNLEADTIIRVSLPYNQCSPANAVVGSEFRFFANGTPPFDDIVLKTIPAEED